MLKDHQSDAWLQECQENALHGAIFERNNKYREVLLVDMVNKGELKRETDGLI